MKCGSPECLVDHDAVRLRNEARPFPEQELMRNNPDVGVLLALPLITADVVEVALLILVLARPRRDGAKCIGYQRGAIELTAHFLARLLRIVRPSPAIDASRDPGLDQVAYDLVAEPVSRYRQD